MKTDKEKIDEIIAIIDDVIADVKKKQTSYTSEDQMVEDIKLMLGYNSEDLEDELAEEIRKFIRKWNK